MIKGMQFDGILLLNKVSDIFLDKLKSAISLNSNYRYRISRIKVGKK